MTLWQRDMLYALETVAHRMPEFTNDDVFEQYEADGSTEEGGIDVCQDRRSYGPVVQAALREETITWTGRAVVSRRKNCHKMLIRVYKSNIYKPSIEPQKKSWWKKLWNKYV